MFGNSVFTSQVCLADQSIAPMTMAVITEVKTLFTYECQENFMIFVKPSAFNPDIIKFALAAKEIITERMNENMFRHGVFGRSFR